MAYIKNHNITVTLSTLGAGSEYSTTFNGLVQNISVRISKAIGASGKVTITSETTTKSVLTVADPSTVTTWYYPRAKSQGTTGNTLAATTLPTPTYIPLADERLKISVATSSGLAGQTVSISMNVGG